MEAVRTFGIAEEIAMVAESFSPCGEVEAWAMASLACKFLETDGVYRVPGKASDLFLLLFDLHKKS